MSGGRHVVLGLAPPRAPWFTAVSRWATVGSIPVEFVKCVSVDELRARIDTGRSWSAALLDARLPAVDRDLLATLEEAGIAAIIVGSPTDHRDWTALGAPARLPDGFDRTGFVEVLTGHGRLISSVTERFEEPLVEPRIMGWLAPSIAVVGRSGSGASTVAISVAQHLSRDPRYAGDVVLADLARRAHQAVLHDARDVVPGIQEIIDLHRTGDPAASELSPLVFDVPSRGYRLVLGLRHSRDWVTIRPRALAASLESLRRMSRALVVDTDPDLEGEAETGSFDIEDRHLLGRAVATTADLVVLVALPTLTGLHVLSQQVDELRHHGIDGEQLLIVLNRAPRSARARAELTRVVTDLTGNRQAADPHLGPVFVPERRNVDGLHRDVAIMPAALTEPVGTAVLEALARRSDAEARLTSAPEPEPVPITPGSLGSWSEEAP